MDTVSTDPCEPKRCDVLGVGVDACRDVKEAALALHARGGGQIVTLNAEMTMSALADASLGAAFAAADLVIPDGAGVVWALARQGIRVPRSPGIELAWSLLQHAELQQWTVALVGASPQAMGRLQVRLQRDLPSLRLVLAEHGFQPVDAWPDLESRLLALNPDLVLVALGVPRQETWAQRLHCGQPGLWMGVGGSFDVWAGLKQRAPRWMGQLRLEWLYRLIQEPTRWRRMLALPAFVLAVLRRHR